MVNNVLVVRFNFFTVMPFMYNFDMELPNVTSILEDVFIITIITLNLLNQATATMTFSGVAKLPEGLNLIHFTDFLHSQVVSPHHTDQMSQW